MVLFLVAEYSDLSYKADYENHMEEVNKQLEEIEKERQKKLQNNRMIGRVVSLKTDCDYNIKIRRVNFKWQRGIKLGD